MSNQVFLRIAEKFKHQHQISGEVVESLDMQWHPLESYHAHNDIRAEFSCLDIKWLRWVLEEYSNPSVVSLEVDENSDFYQKALQFCQEKGIKVVRVVSTQDDNFVYEEAA